MYNILRLYLMGYIIFFDDRVLGYSKDIMGLLL